MRIRFVLAVARTPVAENLLSALRRLYKHAERDRLIDPSSNPASAARLPGRRTGRGDVLTSEQLRDVHRIASSTGDDPELDELIVMLHIRTACDRQAAIDLALHDLDHENCLVRLRRRGGGFHWHPVSSRLMAALGRHADRRGGQDITHRVLRKRNGRPISRRRYDGLWDRVRDNLSWAQESEVTTSSITETVRAHVRQLFGETVERVYVGQHHEDTAVLTHLRGDVIEVLMTITGESHPLARIKRAHHTPLGRRTRQTAPANNSPWDQVTDPRLAEHPRGRGGVRHHCSGKSPSWSTPPAPPPRTAARPPRTAARTSDCASRCPR